MKYISRKTYKIVQFFLTIICLFAIFFVPENYSLKWCIFSFACYIISFLGYIIQKEDQNFFDFNILFSVSFFYTHLAYPVFIFPTEPHRYFIFCNPFNINVITKATLTSVIGYLFYMDGFLFAKEKLYFNNFDNRKNYSTIFPIICTGCIVFIELIRIFVLKAGMVYGVNADANPAKEADIWSYFKVLHYAVILASLSVVFYNIYLRKESLKKALIHYCWFWVMLLVDIIATATTGVRPVAITLACFAGFIWINRRFSLKLLLTGIGCGLVILNYLLVLRSHGTFQFNINIFDLGMDLIVSGYPLYVAFDYVNAYFCIPSTLWFSLAGTIPYLSKIVMNLFQINVLHTSSAIFFSFWLMGDNPTFGTGTSIIAALYLGTGLFGVIAFMFLLGMLIKKTQSTIFISKSPFHLAIALVLFSQAIYWSRAEYFFPARYIVWTLFIVLFYHIVRDIGNHKK